MAPDLPPTATLSDLLLAAETTSEPRLVVVFDQFEELFLYSGEQARQEFVRQMAECITHSDLDTRFVVSVRDDAFVRLGAFEAQLPEIFHNTFILQPLEQDQALQAVLEPLHRLGLDIDPDLLDQIVRELAQQKADGQTAVDPPQLQIVLDQLYDEMLKRGDTRITRADYAKLGGVAKALPTYLRQTLDQRPEAKAVLEALVGEGGAKTQRSLDEISRQLPEGSPDPMPTLEALIGVRLVRPVKVGDVQCYELTHDVLAAAVWTWLSTTAQEATKARGVLERGLSDWHTSEALLDRSASTLWPNDCRIWVCWTTKRNDCSCVARLSARHDVAGWMERLCRSVDGPPSALELASSGTQRQSCGKRPWRLSVLSPPRRMTGKYRPSCRKRPWVTLWPRCG